MKNSSTKVNGLNKARSFFGKKSAAAFFGVLLAAASFSAGVGFNASLTAGGSIPLPVAKGGTGASTFAAGQVLLGNGGGSVTSSALKKINNTSLLGSGNLEITNHFGNYNSTTTGLRGVARWTAPEKSSGSSDAVHIVVNQFEVDAFVGFNDFRIGFKYATPDPITNPWINYAKVAAWGKANRYYLVSTAATPNLAATFTLYIDNSYYKARRVGVTIEAEGASSITNVSCPNDIISSLAQLKQTYPWVSDEILITL